MTTVETSTFVETGHSLKPAKLDTLTREELEEQFLNSWNLYETIYSSIRDDETFYLQGDPLRHPLIFYYGHEAALYVNKFMRAGLIKTHLNKEFEILFETGVDEMSWDTIYAESHTWPTVDAVREYRSQVYDIVLNAIRTQDHQLPITESSPQWPILMGIEHSRIHLETCTLLFRQIPEDLLQRPINWNYAPYSSIYVNNAMVEHQGGRVTLGKPRDFPFFGWDNEYGKEVVSVAPFEASKYLITNGEYLAFVQSGEYENEKNWNTEGWQWKSDSKAKHPRFWIPSATDLKKERKGSLYRYRATFEVIELPLNWPVHVNYYEAYAFCKWKGEDYRLIREAEWHLLAEDEEREDSEANIEYKYASSSPVDMLSPTKSGFYDVMGNAWEWSESYFRPLPGFKPDSLYEDFSTPCFDNKHHLILGGSWASSGCSATKHGRFGFRDHFYQQCGFRIVRTVAKEVNKYEAKVIHSEYMLMHYGKDEDLLPYTFGPKDALNFPKRCADLCIKHSKEDRRNRALDLGCAVGRSSFELAKAYKKVIGVDNSHSFIQTSLELKDKGSMLYEIYDEGDLTRTWEAKIPEEIDRSKVHFECANALDLPSALSSFDCVLMANLIDRLLNPRSLLNIMGSLVRKNGILVITSPYTWREKYTPKENWLGGYSFGDKAVRSFETLKSILTDEFDLLDIEEMPFLMREHSRKYQWIVSHATVWKKK